MLDRAGDILHVPRMRRKRISRESEKNIDGFKDMIATLEGAIKKLSFSDDSESEASAEEVPASLLKLCERSINNKVSKHNINSHMFAYAWFIDHQLPKC